jgi:hypothetical protein
MIGKAEAFAGFCFLGIGLERALVIVRRAFQNGVFDNFNRSVPAILRWEL